jgi:hypothetical protein
MDAPTAGPAPSANRQSGPGRVIAIVFGCLAALVAVALVLGGLGLVFAHAFLRDSGGFYTSDTRVLTTPGYAITTEDVDFGDDGWGTPEDLATVRLRADAAGGAPVFIGIARSADVGAYLRGVRHSEVVDFGDDRTRYRLTGGERRPVVPGRAGIWVASTEGTGRQSLRWDVRGGEWSAVIMRPAALPGVRAVVDAGLRIPWLPWAGLALVVAGVLVGGVAAGLIHLGIGRVAPAGAVAAGTAATAAPVAEAAVAAPYPVDIEARLDEPLSPWLWLVKWFLAIPHYIVLAFLWLAFSVLTVIAFFAILFTGRYPRGMFDFNVGVLRWTWRVGYYATNAIATDRYPPFALGEADYPADVTIPYPARLSRGLVLVKWWLLAIPHLVIVSAFLGWWGPAADIFAAPGILPVLVLVAGFVLLFRGRYPRDVFHLVIGINRWCLRVAAYVFLMRDEYPPFRLDR